MAGSSRAAPIVCREVVGGPCFLLFWKRDCCPRRLRYALRTSCPEKGCCVLSVSYRVICCAYTFSLLQCRRLCILLTVRLGSLPTVGMEPVQGAPMHFSILYYWFTEGIHLAIMQPALEEISLSRCTDVTPPPACDLHQTGWVVGPSTSDTSPPRPRASAIVEDHNSCCWS